MNQQYSPGNGYAGHYWAGGYKGEDGQYRWDSGEPFEFNDFIDNRGNDPFIPVYKFKMQLSVRYLEIKAQVRVRRACT